MWLNVILKKKIHTQSINVILVTNATQPTNQLHQQTPPNQPTHCDQQTKQTQRDHQTDGTSTTNKHNKRDQNIKKNSSYTSTVPYRTDFFKSTQQTRQINTTNTTKISKNHFIILYVLVRYRTVPTFSNKRDKHNKLYQNIKKQVRHTDRYQLLQTNKTNTTDKYNKRDQNIKKQVHHICTCTGTWYQSKTVW